MTKSMNPKDIAAMDRVPLHLLPKAGMIQAAMACADGARKYGPLNWRDTPISLTGYISAMGRHLAALEDGEDEASDSGLHHLAHVIATASIILDADLCGTLIDDRTPGHSAELLLSANIALASELPLNVITAFFRIGYEENDSCRDWSGKQNAYGYGVIFRNNKTYYAHRTSYQIYKGSIASDLIVRHMCDHPLCINPEHLLIGTKADNSRDMVERGRSTKGVKNGCTKLTDQEVEEIKRRLRLGERPFKLAEAFSISQQRISDFKREAKEHERKQKGKH